MPHHLIRHARQSDSRLSVSTEGTGAIQVSSHNQYLGGNAKCFTVEEERLESGLPSHSNTPNAEKDRCYTNTQIVNPVVGYPDSGFIDSLEHLPQLESESPEFQNKFPSGSDSSQRTETTRLERSQAPHTWGYSSDNRESLARSARAIEDTLRLTAMYSDSYEATKMIMPP
ncbi:hypothetical protein LENED_006350 [Lentinula edodes]|uniref:Uncharacterized protein n=1 Tax=Lentinula edodes TaxID=5353 RepID=A0A1Q3EBF7_LENED|nr:hypothetical protein LENED_006350 [Lentinula edodes]